MKTCKTIIPLIALSALLVGCSSSSPPLPTPDTNADAGSTGGDGIGDGQTAGSGAGTGGAGGGFAAIAGLWDVSTEDDIQYQEYTLDGMAINWDYDGDAFGDGENCYIRFAFPISHLGGDTFGGFGETATIVVNGDQITITDSFGTDTFPRVIGLSTTDFNLC